MKILKCPACGAPLKKDSTLCDYCGASIFHEDAKTENKKTDTTQTEEKINIFDQIDDSINTVKDTIYKRFKPSFNIFVFILLLIFIFPVAIVYLIFNIHQEKEVVKIANY